MVLEEDEKERKGWTESWAGPGRRLMRCPEMERYMTTLPTPAASHTRYWVL